MGQGARASAGGGCRGPAGAEDRRVGRAYRLPATAQVILLVLQLSRSLPLSQLGSFLTSRDVAAIAEMSASAVAGAAVAVAAAYGAWRVADQR